MAETDINEIFDALVLGEDKCNQNAYNVGYNVGKTNGNIEAYHFGYHHGSDIGSELGYYLGVIEVYSKSLAFQQATDETLIRDVHTITTVIGDISNTVNSDHHKIEKIRALFKKICARLKINLNINKTSLTF